MLNELWWIKTLYPKRHDGHIFDAWDSKYPTFRATRQEMIRMYIRLIRNKK